MTRNYVTILFMLLAIQVGFAQSVPLKVVDSQSGESIPYATVKTNDAQNIITNSEGNASLTGGNATDEATVVVSHMGYLGQQMTIGKLKAQQNIIRLDAGVVELDNVNVSDVKPNPYQIMAEVKKNLQKHYGSSSAPEKSLIFIREASLFRPKELEVEITKSTGFTKKDLQAFNKDITRFTNSLIKSPTKEFTDKLFTYYTAPKKDNKPVAPKLDMIKATRLKDENRSTSIEDMEEIAGKMFLKHVDSTKYYRIKSGWFGSRDTISLRKDFNNKKKKKKNKTPHSYAKGSMVGFMSENSLLSGKKFDFVRNAELYEYTYEGAKYSSANEFIYVIGFKPKKSKAKYTGKIYVSETDFAVVRADYALANGKTEGGINLKLLLGVKASENVSKGTVIFRQHAKNDKYYLQYASIEQGQYFYINRPVKFIELADSEKDVVAFDIKVEGNSSDTTEFLTLSESEVSEDTFNSVKEDDFTYMRLKRYDPKIWQNYSAIEPLEEMRNFQSSEN